MYKFDIRVLLHGISDYSALHAAMKHAGFRRWILGGNGKHCELLPGEYQCDVDATNKHVFDVALAVLRSLYDDDQFALFVSGREERQWIGLRVITMMQAKKL